MFNIHQFFVSRSFSLRSTTIPIFFPRRTLSTRNEIKTQTSTSSHASSQSSEQHRSWTKMYPFLSSVSSANSTSTSTSSTQTSPITQMWNESSSSSLKWNNNLLDDASTASTTTTITSGTSSSSLMDKIKKYQPATKATTTMTNEEWQHFFQQYISHELSFDTTVVRQLFHLYGKKIQQHYPTQESLVHLCSFLKLFFTNDDLRHNARVFIMPFDVILNRVSTLKEFGIRTFTIAAIDSIDDLLQMTEHELCTNFNYIDQEQSCFASLCKVLQIVGDEKKSLLQHIKSHYGSVEKDITLSELRVVCLTWCLATVLNLNFRRVELQCKRSIHHLKHFPLMFLHTNVQYLLHEFHYQPTRVLHNALYTKVHPDNLRLITTKLASIVGEHIYDELIQLPQLLKIDFGCLVENFYCIKQKCNDKFFTRSLSLLAEPPENLRKIFADIETNDDIRQLGLHALGMDYLALNYTKICSRIEVLKTYDIPLNYPSLSFFCVTDTEFDTLIDEINTDVELKIRFYIESLALDYGAMRHQLRTLPTLSLNKRTFDKSNAKRITEFFISMNVPKEQIVQSIYLTLFDYEKVKEAYFNACAQYDQTYTNPDSFFERIFDYLQEKNK